MEQPRADIQYGDTGVHIIPYGCPNPGKGTGLPNPWTRQSVETPRHSATCGLTVPVAQEDVAVTPEGGECIETERVKGLLGRALTLFATSCTPDTRDGKRA